MEKLRQEVFAAYGGRCACPGCDVDDHRFLTIDHIDGGGKEHRAQLGQGPRIQRWLRQQGFPPGYQLLCWNCNCARAIYGECPHML